MRYRYGNGTVSDEFDHPDDHVPTVASTVETEPDGDYTVTFSMTVSTQPADPS
ncbi:hypothetical protein [Streptomyces sp. NBC_00620]|uniref:hypothetical protein n=1 Tax=Streptomyces sp. NBC_00620 TaxID=2903666 RepID=UPI002258784A|nr:hypothetical protein [Streptomyces sp. NBC_00620]MCX4974242.1 hypothetical protein [Streptomyces sp. NBC_00620]